MGCDSKAGGQLLSVGHSLSFDRQQAVLFRLRLIFCRPWTVHLLGCRQRTNTPAANRMCRGTPECRRRLTLAAPTGACSRSRSRRRRGMPVRCRTRVRCRRSAMADMMARGRYRACASVGRRARWRDLARYRTRARKSAARADCRRSTRLAVRRAAESRALTLAIATRAARGGASGGRRTRSERVRQAPRPAGQR